MGSEFWTNRRRRGNGVAEDYRPGSNPVVQVAPCAAYGVTARPALRRR